jgi:hypothetical protein
MSSECSLRKEANFEYINVLYTIYCKLGLFVHYKIREVDYINVHVHVYNNTDSIQIIISKMLRNCKPTIYKILIFSSFLYITIQLFVTLFTICVKF